jgi:HNH endonuclease
MATCSISDCGKPVLGRGWCSKHYDRWLRHGDPLTLIRREPGAGTLHGGYLRFNIGGRVVRNHILVAERALGEPLPSGAQVHHVDGNRQNDANKNLVICQDDGYHKLLHQRTRAFKACGNADFKHCCFCDAYDDPSLMVKFGRTGHCHKQCRNTYNAAYRQGKAS